MRIGLVSTENTNIGDDLVRLGLRNVLLAWSGGRITEFVLINKHAPAQVYPQWHPCRWTDALPWGRIRSGELCGSVLSRFGKSKFDDCDVLVQCGGPVLWPGCHRCEWRRILWDQVLGRLSSRVPVLNLAGGACYPWNEQPDHFSGEGERRFVRNMLGYSTLTTARDVLAGRLFGTMGANVPVLPCSAFLAKPDGVAPGRSENGSVLVNYMEGGGRFRTGDDPSPNVWRETISEFVARIKLRHSVFFLCHSRSEREMVAKIDGSIPVIEPRSAGDYFANMPPAAVAVCNRIHAAMALAAAGVPSVTVGTDSRMLMMKEVGLPAIYLRDATAERLETEVEDLVKRKREESDRLTQLRAQVFDNYTTLIRSHLGEG